VPEFLALIRKSGIVDSPRLETFLEEHPQNGQTPRALATALIQAGLVTSFQAERLLQGKARGFLLGTYRILDRLSSGSGNQVFLAEDQTMGRRVALKVLSLQSAQDPRVVERFRREARAVARLDHPNIVRAYDVGSVGKLHFLVMEYVDGTNLQVLIERQGRLSPAQAARCARQAAQALAHLHQSGLVHRDVKPSNLLLDRSGVVKLADLGLARFFHDQKDQLTHQQGLGLMGTLDYVSPEQAQDSHAVDIRTDIYSLGATLYFLLIGHPPFQGGSVTQKMVWGQLCEPEDVRELRPEVPEGLAVVLRRMMAKQPEQRYQTCLEVIAALIPWEIDGPSSPGQPSSPEMPPLPDPDESESTEAAVEDTLTSPRRGDDNFPRPGSGTGTKSGVKSANPRGRGSPNPSAARPFRRAPESESPTREPGVLARRGGWRQRLLPLLGFGAVGVVAGVLLWLAWRGLDRWRQKTLPEPSEPSELPGLFHLFKERDQGSGTRDQGFRD
jgi:serine/threonine protein kinase